MRIIKRKRLTEFKRLHPDAASALDPWFFVAKRGMWNDLDDVRRDFRSADGVKVRSGRDAVVFNVRGNNYRLIAAIHYDEGRLYLLRFLTHAEYDKDTWKATL